MAVSINKFVVTATTTIPQGTVIPSGSVVAGEPGTGGAAGYGNTSISAGAEDWGMTVPKGAVLVLDSGSPGSALYGVLNGLGVLRAYVPGQDDVGREAISN